MTANVLAELGIRATCSFVQAWGKHMRRFLIRAFFASLIIGAVCLVFRQGLLPAHLTPLPRLDLKHPLPLVVDWQLAELRFDRRLCRETITQSGLIRARQIPDKVRSNGCGWTNAVRMSEAGGASIGVNRVSCQVAAAVALWVQYVVQPAAKRIFGKRVVGVTNYGTYSCRNIVGNSFWQDRRSEHASANAIDISSFRLEGGDTISVLKHWRAKGKKAEFLRAVHNGACSYFRVALSPNFNAAHKDHFHFDRGILWTCK